MDIESDGIWRYPRAYPIEHDGEWWVVLPSDAKERAMMRGLVASEEAPELSRSSPELHTAVEHFRESGWLEEQDAASHLAGHFAQYGGVELCRHGLPVWHTGRAASLSARQRPLARSCIPATVDGQPAVRVRDVQTMLACWSRVENAHHVLAGGNGFSRPMVTDIVAWPILNGSLRRQYEVALNLGPLNADAAHRLVSATVTATMRAARLTEVLIWREQRPPTLGLRADTTLGLYTADMVARIGQLTDDGPYRCEYCIEYYRPRRPPRAGERHVCGRPLCQKQRRRANMAACRARSRPQNFSDV